MKEMRHKGSCAYDKMRKLRAREGVFPPRKHLAQGSAATEESVEEHWGPGKGSSPGPAPPQRQAAL